MGFRKAKEEDLKEILGLAKHFYEKHHRFSSSDALSYLTKQFSVHDVYLYDEPVLQAAVILVRKQHGDHLRVRLRHFCWVNEEAAGKVLTAIEELLRSEAASVKLEVHVASSEQSGNFYDAHGFALEGTLTNHYRRDENCYIYGKVL